jgi:hypothetical protein
MEQLVWAGLLGERERSRQEEKKGERALALQGF